MNESNQLIDTTETELSEKHLLFQIEDTVYGLPLSYVLEIIHIQKVTHLPKIAPYIKGIVNLRGKAVPVVDTRSKMGLADRTYDDQTCIIILTIQEMHVGLIVDRVLEVINLSPHELAKPPHIVNTADLFLSSVTQKENKVILNIDCDKFFADDLTLQII